MSSLDSAFNSLATVSTVDFYQKALATGIKPIIGCECYVAPRRLTDKSPQDHKGLSHLLLLAQNQQGYQNLCKLMTVAQLEAPPSAERGTRRGAFLLAGAAILGVFALGGR